MFNTSGAMLQIKQNDFKFLTPEECIVQTESTPDYLISMINKNSLYNTLNTQKMAHVYIID